MLSIPLIKREAYWSKRNILIVGFLLVLVPVALGASTAALQETVPEDIPVAVVAQNDEVTEDELNRASAGLGVFAEPKTVNSEGTPAANKEKAVEMLEREEIYLIIEVPPGLLDPEQQSAEFTFTYDGATAPLHQADSEIESIALERLNGLRETQPGIKEGNVTIENQIEGEQKGLGEFLFPAYMLGLLLFFAFTYVPYELRQDKSVLNRLRLETSMESVVASKLAYLTGVMVIPLVAFHLTGLAMGYEIGSLAPVSFVVSTLVLLGTFLAMGMIAASIMLLTRLSEAGQSLNLLALLGFLAASAIAFPRGAVAPQRAQIAEFLPTHYAAVTVRSLLLRDVSVTAYLDMIGTVAAMLVVAALLLKGSIVYYRRTS